MPSFAETLGLSEIAFTLLRDLIHDRTGLFYENDKSDLLTDKLSPLVIERGFNSFLDYYYLLKYDDEGEQEWRRVMDALSVQETYFWREADQIRALVDIIVLGISTDEPQALKYLIPQLPADPVLYCWPLRDDT